MLTRRDPWNNILRATLACFSAGVAGADAITVAPFDAAIGQPDQLARRVARNVHALLVDESHVAQVIDPAGGSWYVEDFTEQLAAKSWAAFQDIERSGGLRAALNSGFIASELAASRHARRDALARRREAVTGVSEFPLIGETLLSRPAALRPDRGSGGLPRIRWSQWHEELRDRSDAYAATTGSPPTLTLAPLDASRASAARAARVAALLAPAGITTVTVDAVPGDAADAGPVPVIIVCGSPDADADEVRAAVDRARAPGCVHGRGGGRGPGGAGARRRPRGSPTTWTCCRSPTGCCTRWGCRGDGRLEAARFHRGRAGEAARDRTRRMRSGGGTRSAPSAKAAPSLKAASSRGSRPRALTSSRCTPPPTWTGSISSPPIPACRRTCAGRTRRCT